MIEYQGTVLEFYDKPQAFMQDSRIDYGKVGIPTEKEMPSSEEMLMWSTSIDLAPETKK